MGKVIHVKPLEWVDVSNEWITCFQTHTNVGPFAYGIDLNRIAYWQSPEGEFDANSLEDAKEAAEASYERIVGAVPLIPSEAIDLLKAVIEDGKVNDVLWNQIQAALKKWGEA